MGETLPFSVEYAKSGRARCQACKETIENTTLRLAKVVQSPFHDGTIVKWFHPDCFFLKQRPKSTADIANYDSIRWEDQQMIQKKIEESCGAAAAPSGAKGKKRGASSAAFKDFTVEYAKSNRSTCIGCEAPIVKGDVRISKKDFESEKGIMLNGIDRWHHLDCFAKLRAELGFFESGKVLPGTKALSAEDLKLLEKALPKMANADIPPPTKKMKAEPIDEEEEKQMKKQNKMMFDIRDKLSTLSRGEITALVQKNNLKVPESQSEKLDTLADTMIFGVTKPCKKCGGQFAYVSGLGYKCTGDLTEWTKCEEVTQDPKRGKFSIPQELKKIPFLASYKSKVQRRIVRVTAPSTSSAVKKEEQQDGPKIKDKVLPLKGMQFVIFSSSKNRTELTKDIMDLGGQVITKLTENVAAIIATEKYVKKGSSKVDGAKHADIQIISEDFVEEAKSYTEAPVSLILKKSICDWGADPSTRVASSMAKSASKGKSVYEKSASGKVKLKIKGGGAVDPDSGLEDVAHIYQDGNDKYTVTLGITDIQSKKNSFYKLQLLKHDKNHKYWLFRSWGRIGTTIGDKRLDAMPLEDCRHKFEEMYEEKTGNKWYRRNSFVKVPGRMYPIDVDHGEDEADLGKFDSTVKSNLKEPVQELIKLIFDVNLMKKVMLEYELDMDKMPLGKLSKKQLQKAYSVLTELQEVTKSNVPPERTKLIDLSNRFYTLVPHSFGVKDVPILESEQDIKNKCDMLDSLLEMEIAYNLMNVKVDGSRNPLDVHYEQLNAEIDVLDKTSEEYDVIKQYVKNTHAATHSHYDLEIDEVFVVKRQGEEQRFKPFKKLPNRKLLWHGSRTTNYVGILSQGLRIAPPEAPVTGYMFGKGIYFADMVSKSANYCCTNSYDSTGLLLLCEVALGNMYERQQADYIEKLPKGKHSTKGVGTTQPDPEKVYKMADGLEVPYGPGVQPPARGVSSLLYNEYIVYDVAQVKTKYLIRMNFKYK